MLLAQKQEEAGREGKRVPGLKGQRNNVTQVMAMGSALSWLLTSLAPWGEVPKLSELIYSEV